MDYIRIVLQDGTEITYDPSQFDDEYNYDLAWDYLEDDMKYNYRDKFEDTWVRVVKGEVSEFSSNNGIEFIYNVTHHTNSRYVLHLEEKEENIFQGRFGKLGIDVLSIDAFLSSVVDDRDINFLKKFVRSWTEVHDTTFGVPLWKDLSEKERISQLTKEDIQTFIHELWAMGQVDFEGGLETIHETMEYYFEL